MPFALCPETGPPRLFRYYNGGDEHPTTILDKKNNLLFINRDKFDRLPPLEREQLLRTHAHINH